MRVPSLGPEDPLVKVNAHFLFDHFEHFHIARFLLEIIEFLESIPFDFIYYKGLDMVRLEYCKIWGIRKALAA